jgi:hypothetical protein
MGSLDRRAAVLQRGEQLEMSRLLAQMNLYAPNVFTRVSPFYAETMRFPTLPREYDLT